MGRTAETSIESDLGILDMKYKARIIDTKTGESRTFETTTEYPDSLEFYWTDGNFGCDCNRGYSFIRAAGGQPTDEEFDAPCTQGRYLVPTIVFENGEVIEIDGWQS